MNGKSVINVKIENIIPNRFQPRLKFNEEELNELANSIKTYGVIEPMILRQVGDKYEIIAGERRYKATQLAGLKEVPAIIMNLDDKTSAELALVENIQRKELSPLEEAMSYKKLLDLGQTTQEQLAIKLGKSQSSIANKLRLLNLPKEVQDALLKNLISERHARSILQIKDNNLQIEVLNKIIKERMTVRDTDEYIKKLISQNQPVLKGPIMNIENNMNDTINLNELAKEQNNNVQSALNEIDIIDGSSSVFNDTEPVIEEKKENIQMNQTNNQNRFFPSLEEQAVNMTFNQPMSSVEQQPNINNYSQSTPVVDQPINIMQPANTIPNVQLISNSVTEIPVEAQAIQTPPSVIESVIQPSQQTEMPIEQPTFNNYSQPTPVVEQPQPIINIPTDPIQSIEKPKSEMIQQVSVDPIIESAPVVEEIKPIDVPIPSETAQLPYEATIPYSSSNIIPTPVVEHPEMNNQIPTETVNESTPTMPEKPTISTVDVNKAIYDVKELTEKLRASGFEVTLNELDLGNEYQLVIRIKE